MQARRVPVPRPKAAPRAEMANGKKLLMEAATRLAARQGVTAAPRRAARDDPGAARDHAHGRRGARSQHASAEVKPGLSRGTLALIGADVTPAPVGPQWVADPGAPICYVLHNLAMSPTAPALLDSSARPYFLWWTDLTVGEYRQRLQCASSSERAYWLGALLREANSRDVWLFTTPGEVRAAWPELRRHLGHARARWAFLLDIVDPVAHEAGA